eukprot:gene9717-biopygen7076
MGRWVWGESKASLLSPQGEYWKKVPRPKVYRSQVLRSKVPLFDGLTSAAPYICFSFAVYT